MTLKDVKPGLVFEFNDELYLKTFSFENDQAIRLSDYSRVTLFASDDVKVVGFFEIGTLEILRNE